MKASVVVWLSRVALVAAGALLTWPQASDAAVVLR